MRWTGSLIRIAEHEIEGLRRRVAEVAGRREACEALIERLHAEAKHETERAKVDAEAGWYLIGFRQGWKIRQERAQAELAAVKLEEQGARDALAAAFSELKKVELVAENARAVAARTTARREGASLDEMALRRSGTTD